MGRSLFIFNSSAMVSLRVQKLLRSVQGSKPFGRSIAALQF